jgi:ATP-binding cassette, subfamily B, bacterial IrtA/YbtP
MTAPAADKPIAALLRPIRGRLVSVIVVQVLASALLLSPLITGSLLAAILVEDASDPRIWPTPVVGLGLLAVGLLLKGIADLLAHLADNTLTLMLRRRLAARLRGAALPWFTDTTAGEVEQGKQDDVSAMPCDEFPASM